MTDRARYFVHLLPSLVPPGALEGSVAVALDVLRATTVMVRALASGCEAVIPCLEIDDARRAAAELPEGTALLGGERHALPIEGFDLGNSPGDYTPERCRGKTLVMTTTNGTRCILSCLEAERVLVAGFVNQLATCRALKADGRPVHLVCSGTDGQVSFEDGLLAGALASRLSLMGLSVGNDEAEVMMGQWSQVEAQMGAEEEGWREGDAEGEHPMPSLTQAIGHWRGGRRLRSLALWKDVREAARLDQFDLVAELRDDPLRIIKVGEM
jgi:2-phosphosulfolactate phosphatase